jgi:hypothetical protein
VLLAHKVGQQQVDALALLAEAALDHGLDPGAPGERYLVVVQPASPGHTTPRTIQARGPSVFDGMIRLRE